MIIDHYQKSYQHQHVIASRGSNLADAYQVWSTSKRSWYTDRHTHTHTGNHNTFSTSTERCASKQLQQKLSVTSNKHEAKNVDNKENPTCSCIRRYVLNYIVGWKLSSMQLLSVVCPCCIFVPIGCKYLHLVRKYLHFAKFNKVRYLEFVEGK